MISTVKKLRRWPGCLRSIFAMGLPFVVLNMVSAVMFKDMGISDARIAFWTSLIMWPWTIKFLWEPFLEIFRTKKILRRHDAAPERRVVRPAALALHMPHFFAVTVGGLRGGGLQRRHARHRGRRRLHVGALDRGSGAVYRLAGGVLQPCETGRHGRPGLVRGLAQQAFQRFRGGDLRCLCAVVDGGAGDPLRPARPAGYLPQPRVAVGRKCG